MGPHAGKGTAYVESLRRRGHGANLAGLHQRQTTPSALYDTRVKGIVGTRDRAGSQWHFLTSTCLLRIGDVDARDLCEGSEQVRLCPACAHDMFDLRATYVQCVRYE